MDFLNKLIEEDNVKILNSYIDKNEISQDFKWLLLKKALSLQRKEIVKLFIAKGFKVNREKSLSFHKEETPLHIAVDVGCLESVDILLDKGVSIEIENRNGDTPLILAAKQEKYSIVDILLSKISCVNYKNLNGLSHMHIACMRNRVDIVKKFLQNGVGKNDFVYVDGVYGGYTPLHFAVKFQCVETVDFLLQCGVNVTIQNEKNESPLHIAYELQNERIIDLILSAHIYETKNPINSYKLSHFHIACTRNNIQFITYFLHFLKPWYIKELTACEIIPFSSYINFSPLHLAIKNNCQDVVKLLLDHVDNVKEIFGGRNTSSARSLINLARETKNSEIVELIQAKLNSKNSIAKVNNNLLALHEALSVKDLIKFYNLLKTEGINEVLYSSTSPFWPGYTALHLAVHYKYLMAVKLLIRKDVNIGVKDARGKTPLHIAFESNELSIVDVILSSETGGKSNPADDCGLSHFHISCTRNHLSTIKSFLSNGANVNECVKVDSSFWPGFTPLHFAVTFKRLEVVKLLIKSGVDITIKNGLDLPLIDQAFKSLDLHSSDTSFILYLIELLLLECEEKNLDSFPDKRISLLHIACARNDVKSIEGRLNSDNLNSPVDSDCPIWPSFTPLHFAAYYKSREAIALLLKAGADVSVKDANGNTPLHLAFDGTDRLIDESLISYSDNPTGFNGWSHFHIACRTNSLKAVKRFLKLGINVNMPINHELYNISGKGETPMYLAVRNKNPHVLMRLLLKNGVSSIACDYHLQTPLHLAVQQEGCCSVVRVLLKNGADVRACDVKFKTPLHYCRSATTVDMLVEAGAEVNALDHNGLTPITGMSKVERISSKIEMFEAFLRNGADINLMETWLGFSFMRFDENCWDDHDDIQEGPRKIFMKHIRKLINLGFYVNKFNVEWYSKELLRIEEHWLLYHPEEIPEDEIFDEAKFDIECVSEINIMNSMKISDRASVRDVLFMKGNQMAKHAQNIVFNNIIQSKNFDERFPIYGYLLKLQLKNGLNRKQLLDSSEISMIILTRHKIPSLCTEKIFQFLNDKDLLNLTFSTKDMLDKVQKY